MRYAITIFSLLLAGCSNTTVLGCPEVKNWDQADQNALLHEISRPEFRTDYPETYRALREYQDMRVTSRPCAL